jgi:DNA-directed RNA polymerase specialized sigma24 family protein
MRATLFICLEEARRKVPEAWSAEDLEAAMARYEFALLGEGTGTVAITVDEFLASLDELDRRVLQLTLATPFKSGDIAERVGLSAQAVRQRQSRLRKKLLLFLDEHGVKL